MKLSEGLDIAGITWELDVYAVNMYADLLGTYFARFGVETRNLGVSQIDMRCVNRWVIVCRGKIYLSIYDKIGL